jgi:hypothetical protein
MLVERPKSDSAKTERRPKMGDNKMGENMNEHKKGLSLRWIRAKSGSTYLCPVDALKDIENPTEEQLKSVCVDESHNPQNS